MSDDGPSPLDYASPEPQEPRSPPRRRPGGAARHWWVILLASLLIQLVRTHCDMR